MIKILIIEDEQEQRKFLIDVASEINPTIEVISTDSYEQALKIIAENQIQAFFIDIQLIDGNGIELAKEIRTRQKYRFTPIVFITGVPTKEMEAFHNIHCYDYLIKPYSKPKLMTVMKSILVDYLEDRPSDNQSEYLILDFKNVKQKIAINAIQYIEQKNRRIVIVTCFEQIRYKCISLKRYQTELDQRFIQVHQSIMVNRSKVKSVDYKNKQIAFYDIEEKIPLGLRYKDNIEELIHANL